MSAAWRRFCDLRDAGRQLINVGVDKDRSEPSEALDLYTTGVAQLEQAMAITLPEAERRAGDEAKRKLSPTINMAKERIDFLQKEQKKRPASSASTAPQPGFLDYLFSSFSSPSATEQSKPETRPKSAQPVPSNLSRSQTSAPPPAAPRAKEPTRSESFPAQNRHPTSPVNRNQPNTNTNTHGACAPAKKVTSKQDTEEERLRQQILDDIVDTKKPVAWDDVGGLKEAKKLLYEALILPSKRPDLFVGLRAPPKGLLLFGPPGNGKTMLARAASSQAGCTFFSISASTMTSKWFGEGEKLVKVLFSVARSKQPALIFIDEIDSILSERSGGEHDASRRIKTEFLVQMDGAATDASDRVFVMGATNRPQDLDEAVRRRLAHRIYVPLPDQQTRREILSNALKGTPHNLSQSDMDSISKKLEGYSGSDITAVCKDAAFGPIRECGSKLEDASFKAVRPIESRDFDSALTRIRPSVGRDSLQFFEKWNSDFGSRPMS